MIGFSQGYSTERIMFFDGAGRARWRAGDVAKIKKFPGIVGNRFSLFPAMKSGERNTNLLSLSRSGSERRPDS